jgi:phage shock protein A
MEQLFAVVNQMSNPIMALCAVYVASLIRDINNSIQALNTKIAVIIERVDSHEKRLNRLEE